MRILIRVSYDGSQYYGWQIQNGFVTIQQRLEEALCALFKKEVAIRGASRTDTGVHSLGQIAVFSVDTTIPINKIPYAINSFLPQDIVITYAEEVSEEFHPQYSVINKTYEYKILNAEFRNPMLYNYTDYVRGELDIELMKEACKYFIGEHDFKAFCASGSTAKTTVRTIYALEVIKKEDIITVRVNGSGFLYNMVRILVGTLVSVGQGKIKPSDIEDIILSGDRARAGKTLVPNGLTLMEVNYER